MKQLTPEAAQALTNLRGNRDFEAFLKWVKEYEDSEREKCVDGEGVVLHQAQGATKALRRIREAQTEAPATLNKFINKAQSVKHA